MFLYKFRAECQLDVYQYFKNNRCLYYVIHPDPKLPDCEVVMGSNLALDEIRKQMEEIPDSHVMIETINHYDLYTGDRYYCQYDDCDHTDSLCNVRLYEKKYKLKSASI